MRSLEIAVDFATPHLREVPKVGTRKRLKVNGQWETLYANEVEVSYCYDHGRSTAQEDNFRDFYHYVGTVTYGPYHAISEDRVRRV